MTLEADQLSGHRSIVRNSTTKWRTLVTTTEGKKQSPSKSCGVNATTNPIKTSYQMKVIFLNTLGKNWRVQWHCEHIEAWNARSCLNALQSKTLLRTCAHAGSYRALVCLLSSISRSASWHSSCSGSLPSFCSCRRAVPESRCWPPDPTLGGSRSSGLISQVKMHWTALTPFIFIEKKLHISVGLDW